MTNNNEIIIDGVNVAGCEHYREGFCYRCNFGGCVLWRCSDKTEENCNYKQLQREKQKNEELEEALQEARKCLTISEKSNDIQLEHWFTRYNKISEYRSIWKEYATIQFKVKKALKRVLNARKQKINKYKQALADIKDVIERQDCDNCLKQLAKINEVCSD